MTDCKTSGQPVPEHLDFGDEVFCPYHFHGRWLPRRRHGNYSPHKAPFEYAGNAYDRYGDDPHAYATMYRLHRMTSEEISDELNKLFAKLVDKVGEEELARLLS